MMGLFVKYSDITDYQSMEAIKVNSCKPQLLSTLKIDDLDTRLKKYRFLTKGSLPGFPDASIFTILKKLTFIPNRQNYPNLYHWYILMKQFASGTLDKWTAKGSDTEDALVQEILTNFAHVTANNNGNGLMSSKNTISSSICTKGERSCDMRKKKDGQNLSKSQVFHHNSMESSSKSEQPEYIMNLQLKNTVNFGVDQLKSRLFSQKIQLSKLSILGQEPGTSSIQIILKMNDEIFSQTTDKIYQWPEVYSVQIKRKKKQASNMQKKGSLVLK